MAEIVHGCGPHRPADELFGPDRLNCKPGAKHWHEMRKSPSTYSPKGFVSSSRDDKTAIELFGRAVASWPSQITQLLEVG
jgi:hypothetical protein